MSEEKVNINDYIALHESGIQLSRVNPIANQTFRVLKDSGVDVRIIDRDKNLNRLYRLGQLETFTKDTVEHSHRFFYSIPLQTVTGTIVGFIYRTVFGKAYTTVSRSFEDKEHKLPLMFGFYKDFADFEDYDYCKPIIVCEGLKDCITLKKIYPYVLSNNTSHMGINLQVLSNLTDKFILIYDNDKAGDEGTKDDFERIAKMKYDVIRIRIGSDFKDVTDCAEDMLQFAQLKAEILDSIKRLETSNMGQLGRESLVKR